MACGLIIYINTSLYFTSIIFGTVAIVFEGLDISVRKMQLLEWLVSLMLHRNTKTETKRTTLKRRKKQHISKREKQPLLRIYFIGM